MGQEQKNTAPGLDIKLGVNKKRHLGLGKHTSTVGPFYLFTYHFKKGFNIIISAVCIVQSHI